MGSLHQRVGRLYQRLQDSAENKKNNHGSGYEALVSLVITMGGLLKSKVNLEQQISDIEAQRKNFKKLAMKLLKEYEVLLNEQQAGRNVVNYRLSFNIIQYIELFEFNASTKCFFFGKAQTMQLQTS